MFAILLVLVIFAIIGLCLAGSLVWLVKVLRHVDRDPIDEMDFVGSVGATALSVLALLFTLALVTGDLSLESVPDGCYRIGTTTSTGVSIGPKGAVTPIVLSGKSYTPIACP